MKKALMYWISPDGKNAAAPVWVDIPETERDREQLDARKDRLANNPIARRELVKLHAEGFMWLYSAAPNQFDGYGEEDDECCDRAHIEIGGSQ